MAFALTTLRTGQASASRFARCLAPAVAPSPSSSTSVRFASSSNSPKRTSTRPAPARKATDKKMKKGSADPVLVRRRGGELVVSDSYLEDLANLQLRPANPSPSNSPSTSRKPKGKVSQTPRRVTYSLAQQEEVQAFLEAKKAEERASKRTRAELSLSLRKRNRWSSEWFLDEGRELAEIGLRISQLKPYYRKEPYAPEEVTDWIISHLRSTPAPRAAEATSSSLSDSPLIPLSSASHSLHLLTPETWDRLKKPHPFWSTKSFEESLGAALTEEDRVDRSVWDLLYARGWRGEGVDAPPVPSPNSVRSPRTISLSSEVLGQYLKPNEIPSARQDLLVGGSTKGRELDGMPESTRIALALERLRKMKSEDGLAGVLRDLSNEARQRAKQQEKGEAQLV